MQTQVIAFISCWFTVVIMLKQFDFFDKVGKK
jgi:hypothetical protein